MRTPKHKPKSPMDCFFVPRSIAVIGATPNRLKGGNAILRNLLFGFDGNIYPVNPRYDEIEGLACYPSAQAIPGRVDLAIVFVAASLVPAAIEDCAAKGIPGAMIESGGFSETGLEGKQLQQKLVEVASRTGIRLWGPNCMGLVDVTHGRVFSFMDPKRRKEGFVEGVVSLIVQSGMLSSGFLIDISSHALMGISKVCSVGNKVDVNECDILGWLLADPATEVIGLYLESIPDGRRFLELCRESTKPICVLKGGRSDGGAAAAMSHTASLAGNHRVVAGALAQAGVVEARDFRQMIDLCRSLALLPTAPGQGKRVAVVTFSGGAGIVTVDALAACGLEVAELSRTTRKALEALYPAWMPVAHPVDLYPALEQHIGTGTNIYDRALKAVLADPGVDALFLHLMVGNSLIPVHLPSLAPRIRATGKPVVVWPQGHRDAVFETQKEGLVCGIPVFSELFRAAECLAAAMAKRDRPAAAGRDRDAAPPLPAPLQVLLREVPAGPLDEQLSKEILRYCGIPTVEERGVTKAAEAEAFAAAVGYPVVLKGLLPGNIHKTEQGLVALGVADAGALRRAYRGLRTRMGAKGKLLVQRQIEGRVELILGLLRDPQFGPCVMFGLGGILAEAMDDAAFAVAPLTEAEALALVHRIRGRRLLDGFRGAPPVDREALARMLVALGDLALAEPRIAEIDINPLICGPRGPVAVDAAIIFT